MARTYKQQILSWGWPEAVLGTRADALSHGSDPEPNARIAEYPDCTDGCDADGHVGCYYLGSVMSLTPSGKFYTFWTTNQTSDDVDRDTRWYAALEAVANKYEGWIESGEGDPTDLYFCRYWPTPNLNIN
jgi:hypothetical protein